ncbi:hypothetical protein GCM10027162_69230 [Streptomyces incanus]
MRENRTRGLKRRELEMERKPPRQSPALLRQCERAALVTCRRRADGRGEGLADGPGSRSVGM